MLISQCKHLKTLQHGVMVIILAITTLALHISTWTGVGGALSHNLIHTNCRLYNKSVCVWFFFFPPKRLIHVMMRVLGDCYHQL